MRNTAEASYLCGISTLIENTHLYHVTQSSYVFALVDPRGVEPLSENLLIQLSPGAVCYLNFPLCAVSRQTSLLGSHFLRGRLNGERPTHVHRLLDAQSEAAIFFGGTGGAYGHGTALRQPLQRFR